MGVTHSESEKDGAVREKVEEDDEAELGVYQLGLIHNEFIISLKNT
jgi:hypothetical protein